MDNTDGNKAAPTVRTSRQKGKTAQSSPDKAVVLARAAARRERHRQRRWAVRMLVVLAGLLLSLAGLPLLVAPEVGLPLLVVGLGLLALEYEWAARAQGWVEWRVLQIRHWWKSQPRVIKGGVVLLVVVVLVLVAWWFFF